MPFKTHAFGARVAICDEKLTGYLDPLRNCSAASSAGMVPLRTFEIAIQASVPNLGLVFFVSPSSVQRHGHSDNDKKKKMHLELSRTASRSIVWRPNDPLG